MIYSPNKHGYSFEQFLLRSGNISPHLIIIEDMQDTVFGAFVTDGWKIRNPPVFFGAGESFLFTFKNFENQPENQEKK